MSMGGDALRPAKSAELAAQGGFSADPDGPKPRHFPGARRLRLGWQRDANGEWQATGTDRRRFEVLCSECGDTDGPIEEQPPAARELRGPYRNERRARHAEQLHLTAWLEYPPRR